MKCTQNEKILQVTERTLIVGVDIASDPLCQSLRLERS